MPSIRPATVTVSRKKKFRVNNFRFLLWKLSNWEGFNVNRQTLGKLLVVLAAAASFLLSVGLWFAGQREEGLFVGIWVPSIFSFGTLLLTGRRPSA
jgi:hypothetical protein